MFFPWDDDACPNSNRPRSSALKRARTAAECPGQIRPFNPTLEAGTSTPTAGAFSSFTLKLNREDGDQYLGKLNFTMPPGLTANLHGVTYCPEADIAAAADTAGQSRAGRSELSGVLRNRHLKRRRRSRLPSLPRGRQDLHGRSLPGRTALAWSRSPRPWPAPTTTAPSWSASPSTSIPPMPT